MPKPRFRDNHPAPAGQVPGAAQRSIFGLRGVPAEHNERTVDIVDSLADKSVHGRQRLSTGELPLLFHGSDSRYTFFRRNQTRLGVTESRLLHVLYLTFINKGIGF